MRTREMVFCGMSLVAVATMLYLVVTYDDPDPDRGGMFARIVLPDNHFDGSIPDYFRWYFGRLDAWGWVKFALGILFGIFVYIGFPQLVERYGGKGWREGE